MSWNSTEQCVWLLSSTNLTGSAHEMTKVCFDLTSPLVTSVTLLSQDASETTFTSNLADADTFDQVWVHLAAAMVFFMQNGFTMLEAGAVKNINVQNILFKNMMDACIGTLVWFLWGYTIAFGIESDSDSFMGGGNLALNKEQDWTFFFFQWTFAVTSATIVSGSVAERCSLFAYGFYTMLLTSWVYPVVAHWIWSEQGWLSAFNSDISVINGGIIDFAGSGVVHTIGGWSGLMGAVFLGPRIGYFSNIADSQTNVAVNKNLKAMKHEHTFGNNVVYQVMGLFFLWFGWYGFNCGSTLAANGMMEVANKVAVNTTFAGAVGGLSCCLMTLLIEGYFSVPAVVNGVLAGFVSITAGCPVVDVGASINIGFLGAVFYFAACKFLEALRIDDPLKAWPVHGICGTWGVLAIAFFGDSQAILAAGYNETLATMTRGEMFSNQLFAIVCIIAWTLFWIGGLFCILGKFKVLRVSKHHETEGLDAVEHGGDAVEFITPQITTKDGKKKFQRQLSVFNKHLDKNGLSPNELERLSPVMDHINGAKIQSLKPINESHGGANVQGVDAVMVGPNAYNQDNGNHAVTHVIPAEDSESDPNEDQKNDV